MSQREVAVDTASFSHALRSVRTLTLILVGEMREAQDGRNGASTAETARVLGPYDRNRRTAVLAVASAPPAAPGPELQLSTVSRPSLSV